MNRARPLIGIKYCGACHPAYDRAGALREILAFVADRCIFENVRENTLYDAVLVMNGCPAQCADTRRLQSSGGFLSCFNLSEPGKLAAKLLSLANAAETE